MVHNNLKIIFRIRFVLPILILMCFVTLSTGCSYVDKVKRKTGFITKKATRKVTEISQLKFSDSGLKKKVAIAAIADKSSFLSQDFGQALLGGLGGNLKGKCGKTLFFSYGEKAYPNALNTLPVGATGRIDNFELAKIGRRNGMNAIVTGSVLDIREYAEDKGFLWLRDRHKFLQVLVDVAVYDTETGAKLVDESHLYETELDSDDLDEAAPDKKSRIPLIEEAISDAAEILSIEICDAVEQQPWAGYIVLITEKHIGVSSGSDVGLSVGMELDVFGKGGIIQGVEGQVFFKPGGKTGEIRITEIFSDRSVAEIISGKGIQIGSVVRPKE